MRHGPTILLASLMLLSSCSQTRLLPGEYRMRKSKAVIVDNGELTPSDVTAYIRSAEKYSPTVVESSVRNIDNHLKYLGYYKSEIRPETEFSGKKARVTYNIYPKGRIRVDSLAFFVPEDGELRKEFIRNTRFLSLREGDYLSEAALVAESDRSASFLRNRGYYDITKNLYRFVADSVSVPGKMILEYHIEPLVTPRKYTVGEVRINYPQDLPFRDKVLRDLNSIHPGDRYSDRAVNVAYGRFSNLKLFNTVNVEMNPSQQDSSVVDCDINLTSSDIQGFKVNAEVSVNSSGLFGISPKLSYFHKNIFHGGEWLNLDFNGNFQRRFSDRIQSNEFGVSATLSLPRFLGIPYSRFRADRIPRTEFKASFNYQSRPEYTRRSTSLSYSYSGNNAAPKNYLTYQFTPLKLNAVKLGNLSESFLDVLIQNPMLLSNFLDHIDAGVTANLYYSDAPTANPKTDFKYCRAVFSLSGNVISIFRNVLPVNYLGEKMLFGLPYSQYARAEFQFGKTLRFGIDNRQAFATRFLLGIGKGYGNSTSLPFEESFYGGGANSMRAWQARALGPGAASDQGIFIIPSQVGDMKLELDAEYRFPLFWKLNGAIFAEVGNIWSLNHTAEEIYDYKDPSLFRFNTFYKQLAADWGLGIRLDFDLIVLRLDYGMKICDPSRANPWLRPAEWFGKNGFGLHFGVGYPF